MKSKDVKECVGIVASHPILSHRYGRTITQLGPALLRVLGSEAFRTVAFEEFQGATAHLVGVAMSAFVTDLFLQEIKTAPFFWIGPALATRIMRGESPLLSDAQVCAANRSVGLNVVLWHLCIDPKDAIRAEVQSQVTAGFFDAHRGFLLKELIALQGAFAEEPDWIVDGGGLLLNPTTGEYVDPTEKPGASILATPHVLGISRELALTKMSWIGSLFHHDAPKIAFSKSEQRLLVAALRGGTDEELSDELAISLSAVKKAWRSVYERAAVQLPESILGHDDTMERENGERGKQKKQRLLGYLRDHLEELRPHARTGTP